MENIIQPLIDFVRATETPIQKKNMLRILTTRIAAEQQTLTKYEIEKLLKVVKVLCGDKRSRIPTINSYPNHKEYMAKKLCYKSA